MFEGTHRVWSVGPLIKVAFLTETVGAHTVSGKMSDFHGPVEQPDMRSSDVAANSAVFALNNRGAQRCSFIMKLYLVIKDKSASLIISECNLILFNSSNSSLTGNREIVKYLLSTKALLLEWDFSCGYRKQLGHLLGKSEPDI